MSGIIERHLIGLASETRTALLRRVYDTDACLKRKNTYIVSDDGILVHTKDGIHPIQGSNLYRFIFQGDNVVMCIQTKNIRGVLTDCFHFFDGMTERDVDKIKAREQLRIVESIRRRQR